MLSLEDWAFEPLSYNHFQFPPTLHVGDYNMDGFPDVVTVVSSSTLVVVSFLTFSSTCSEFFGHICCCPYI